MHAVLLGALCSSIGCHGHQKSPGSDTTVNLGRAHPRILFIGSSTIFFWKTLPADFADVPGTILRRGHGGRTLADIVSHVTDEIIAEHPDKVLIYGGSLDMHDHGRTPEQTFEDFVGLCDSVHNAMPNTTVYFIACKPSLAKWEDIQLDTQLNELVRGLAAREKGVGFIDIYTPMLDSDGKPIEHFFNPKDGNHLNKDGYALWAKIIRPYLVDGK